MTRWSCGRVVQLAMYMRNHDMVRLLLESGAEVYFRRVNYPVERDHVCPSLGRKIYLRITAGLREAASKRKLFKGMSTSQNNSL